MKFQFKGIAAVLVIVAVIGFAAFSTRVARSDLDTGAATEVTRILASEYARTEMRSIADAGELSKEALESLLATQNVELASIKARGRPEHMIVRVNVQVNGAAPPDGRAVRYFQMTHSLATGWRVDRETTAFSYYTKLF